MVNFYYMLIIVSLISMVIFFILLLSNGFSIIISAIGLFASIFLVFYSFNLLGNFNYQEEQERIKYVQKIILENDDKVELISSDTNSNYYRVNLDDFFFDFKIYNNTNEGEIGFNLLTDTTNIFNYFNIDTKNIDINENEILKGNYKPFKEKYMIELK